ncbi:MAG: ATP-binding protein [Rickettsiaceae bacterium]|nr:ATP-binding protein [Rickettsiaceae bacterium]
MNFNIDIAIFISFLIINLIVGLWYGRGIKNIKEYAIGNRNFSTATLAATVISTWISGSFFTSSLGETYKNGLWFFLPALGECVALYIVAIFIAPRVKEFFGCISVAEVMGKLYGQKVRIVAAICSIVNAIGMTSLQIMTFSAIFGYFLGMQKLYATAFSTSVVIIYSSAGGIRSVTFTDALQFLTFGVCIPLFALFVWHAFGDLGNIQDVALHNPNFVLGEIFNYNNPKFFPSLLLFFFFAVPGLNSTMFQRILMAKNTQQIRGSYLAGASITFILHCTIAFIALIVLSHNPNLPAKDVAMRVVNDYSYTGLKGLAIAGIMAMIMSTADSWINTGSVIFAHDFCKPLGISFKNELLISRLFAVFMGCFALFLALSAEDLMKLLLLQGKFYKPIVMPPLALAIFGFRTSTRVVASGMVTAVASVFIWMYLITPYNGIDGIMPSVAANFVAIFFFHYLVFRREGGWVSKKHPESEGHIILDGNSVYHHDPYWVRFRNALSLSNTNLTRSSMMNPFGNIAYFYFAVINLFTVAVTFALSSKIYLGHFYLVNIIQAMNLLISTFFFCIRLYSEDFKASYLSVIWRISIFISLAFTSSFLVLLSNFIELSLMMFVLSITLIGVLLNWQNSIFMSLFGAILSYIIFTIFVGTAPSLSDDHDMNVRVFYIVLIIGSFVLAFLKPKQEFEEFIIAKSNFLESQIKAKEAEVEEALKLRAEFIRNVSHEYNTPMTGVISMAESLEDSYNKLSDKDRIDAIKLILSSARRFKEYDDNITTLGRLSKANYKIEPAEIDLTKLLINRVNECKRIYGISPKNDHEHNDTREFRMDVEKNVMVKLDPKYITQLIDNLVSNAIKYCQTGKITIMLDTYGDKVRIRVEDEGIGIPQRELAEIFTPFSVSSKTKTQSGGRGVGLAACKKIVDVHGGNIIANSDGDAGAIFTVILPMAVRYV